ncbi:MAG: hypothetical protein U1E69_19280 [Tabrizicola sp.]|uniref:hypothetical protein n=1 Tax=Tabrizicola sp. TaxID=2005166 RepID=UPI002ABC7737|nr:hypothetical protein [Tabrizicola sp.]MDZ4088939.1 hypothetical protein [Tabrizicola sp.]
MKSLVLLALLTLAGCSSPLVATNLTFGPDGVEANPTLSSRVGGATVTIDP